MILNEGIKKWEKEKSVDMFDRPRTIITVECFKKQPSSLIGVAITFTIGLSYQVIVLFQFPDPLRFKSRTCRPKYIYVYIYYVQSDARTKEDGCPIKWILTSAVPGDGNEARCSN